MRLCWWDVLSLVSAPIPFVAYSQRSKSTAHNGRASEREGGDLIIYLRLICGSQVWFPGEWFWDRYLFRFVCPVGKIVLVWQMSSLSSIALVSFHGYSHRSLSLPHAHMIFLSSLIGQSFILNQTDGWEGGKIKLMTYLIYVCIWMKIRPCHRFILKWCVNFKLYDLK